MHYLADKFVVFDKSDASNTRVLSELSDDFFDMTIADVKLLYKENKNLLKDLDEGEQLLTQGMRNARKEGNKLTLLQKYKKCLVRIQFGRDGRVVQGGFAPSATIKEVRDSIRQFLEDPQLKFNLYTTPPKRVLEDDSNLLDNHCVPSVLLHVEAPADGNGRKLLKPDLPLSNAAGVEQSVQESGVLRRTAITKPENSAQQSGGNSDPSSSSAAVKRPSQTELKKTPDDKKLPKWFQKGKQ